MSLLLHLRRMSGGYYVRHRARLLPFPFLPWVKLLAAPLWQRAGIASARGSRCRRSISGARPSCARGGRAPLVRSQFDRLLDWVGVGYSGLHQTAHRPTRRNATWAEISNNPRATVHLRQPRRKIDELYFDAAILARSIVLWNCPFSVLAGPSIINAPTGSPGLPDTQPSGSFRCRAD